MNVREMFAPINPLWTMYFAYVDMCLIIKREPDPFWKWKDDYEARSKKYS